MYKECKKAGIKPLQAVEAYITEDEDGLPNEKKTRDNHHLVLIAKDNKGYKGLLELCSEGSMNNFYYKPRIQKKKLARLGGHLIVLSGCLGGHFAKQIDFRKDDYGRAVEVIDEGNKGLFLI